MRRQWEAKDRPREGSGRSRNGQGTGQWEAKGTAVRMPWEVKERPCPHRSWVAAAAATAASRSRNPSRSAKMPCSAPVRQSNEVIAAALLHHCLHLLHVRGLSARAPLICATRGDSHGVAATQSMFPTMCLRPHAPAARRQGGALAAAALGAVAWSLRRCSTAASSGPLRAATRAVRSRSRSTGSQRGLIRSCAF